ncbi:hypothetical protein [Streptomyces sp. NPDC102409]|uniref:hypothetical protein n=1 Tax=Streptomyces sp. NPDC102409 TaxID=3366172 RepID=UPI0038200ED3
MSWVANVMLSVDVADNAKVQVLSEWLRKDAPRRAQPQAHGRVFGTAWREPNLVQLLVMDQEEGFFRMWMIRDNELRQYAPLQPNEDDDGFYLD